MSDLVVASNRGPVSFGTGDGGDLVARRGGGGLVSGLASVADRAEVVWVCAALSDDDRTAAGRAPGGRIDRDGHDTGGAAVRMLDIDASTFDHAYNVVANATLWFVHHMLYDVPNQPVFDADFRTAWAGYVAYNEAFADALAAEAAPDARVLVQDYHLSLVPRLLRERRPDVRIAHFSHTPWAPPEYFRMLPDDVAADLLTGILGADHAGFLSPRWAAAFRACCASVLGVGDDSGAGAVAYADRATTLGVHALGADAGFLTERAGRADAEERRAALREQVGDRRLVVRVDRTELSKNIVRGLLAYADLLRRYPQWRGRVVHLAFAYPSRFDLAEYRAYTDEVRRVAAAIDEEFATADWQPLLLAVEDDFPRSLAAYRLADVLVVNPVRDGMNLVAKEVPVLSERGVAVVLSREAGAYDEVGADALGVNPFDVRGTADALHAALSMPDGERSARTARMTAAATRLPPVAWFDEQVAALG